jgi:enediyne biosynthesis protein E4
MPQRARLFLLIALLGVLLAAMWFRQKRNRESPAAGLLTNSLELLKQFEQQEAAKYWGPELRAQEYGRIIEKLWDGINRATNKLDFVGSTAIGPVLLAGYSESVVLQHGISFTRPNGTRRELDQRAWRDYLHAASANGWELLQCEFRHTQFTNLPVASRYYFSAHLLNQRQEDRVILEGNLVIQWQGTEIASVDASAVQIRSRRGPPGFRKVLDEEVKPKEGSYFIDPLILWDLDDDRSMEIILAAANRVYRRDPAGHWVHSVFCEHDPGLIFTGVLGDFTGNGTTDFLCAKFEGLFLYEGTKEGRFALAPRQVWTAQPHLKYAQALATGDVDDDGDLDLFLGQYKVPYEKGQMPTPYFDANDGYPSFLLLNDGQGQLSDATQSAGLGAKRGRRTYNASLVDLDKDGDLDLMVVSDFAGLDAWQNDGKGRFKNVTESWFPEHQALGMANCFADFDRDGRLDVLMIGMNSPTADRLTSLGLNRPYDLPDKGRRDALTYGNRLLFGHADGTFRKRPMSETVAQTGWSWGCAADDFDQDGYPDLYIANGHETRESVKDYEPEFWLHDIYVGNSMENSLVQLYFREKMARTRGAGWSYGGYEKNRFFLNLGGTNFVECGFLMGVALESDSRNVVAEDLDRDGKLDLAVTTFEIYPKVRQRLQLFRNEMDLSKTGNRDDRSQIHSSGSYRSQRQGRSPIGGVK